MSEMNIDALDVQIETSLDASTAQNITKAANAIKKVADNLGKVDMREIEKLNSVFKGTKEMESYAKSIRTVASGLKTLSGFDTGSLNNAKNTLKEISNLKFDFSNLEGLKNIDFTGLSKFSKDLDTAKRKTKELGEQVNNSTNPVPIEQRMTITRSEDFERGNGEWNRSTGPLNPEWMDAYSRKAVEFVENYKNAKLSYNDFAEATKQIVTPEIRTGNLKELQKEYLNTEKKLDQLIVKQQNDITFGADPTSKPMLNLERQIEETRAKAEALQEKIQEINQGTKTGGVGTGLKNLVISGVGKSLDVAKSSLSKLGSGVLNLSKSFVKAKFSSDRFSGSLQGGFKSMLKYAFGIRSMFVLFNRLRSTMTSSWKNLAQYSGNANRAVSSMNNSLTALKSSLATAFAPIVQSVAPYISTLIDMLTDGMNAIAQFFAAITGSKTVVLAKKTNKDYAASIGGIGSAAGGASDGVKDLAESLDLLDFDEINKLSDNTSGSGSSGGSGGSGGSSGVGDLFTTEEVDSAFADIAELFKNGDWWEIGEIIANGINSGLEKIDELINWDNVGGKITNICNGITTIFNSTVENIDWTLVGKTVGDGVNTVVNTLNLLYEGVDWNNLGSKFAEGVNSIFGIVNWDNLGKLLTQKFNAVWDTAEGFFNNLDGKTIGDSVATTLNNAFKNLHLDSASKALSGALNTLSDVLEGFNATVDWDTLTSNLEKSLKSFIDDVKWGELGENLGTFVGDLAAKIWDTVMDSETQAKLFDAGSQLIGGFVKGVLDALNNGAFGDMMQTISDFLEKHPLVSKILFGDNGEFDFSDIKESLGMVSNQLNELTSEYSYAFTIDPTLSEDGRQVLARFIQSWNEANPEAPIDNKLMRGGDEEWLVWLHEFQKANPSVEIPDSVKYGGAKEVKKWLSEFAQGNTGVVIEDEVAKSGQDLKKHVYEGWAEQTGLKFTVDADAKLTGKLDMSKLDRPVINSTAKLTSSSVNLSRPSIGSTAKFDKYSTASLTGNKKPNVSSTANFSSTNDSPLGSKRSSNKKRQIWTSASVSSITGAKKGLKLSFFSKAMGGVFSNGSWHNLPQFSGGGYANQHQWGRFAGGGLPSHGTAFVAGENGAEIVGNVNGRTEVLNQSQIASAIYSAMIAAQKQQSINVTVTLQGDANTLFKMMQNKSRQYTVQTGKPAFI